MHCCDSLSCQHHVSAGAILNTSGRGQYSLVNTVPHHKIIMFATFEDFQSFLRWGTLFTEGGHYSLVNKVRGDTGFNLDVSLRG